MPFSLISPQQEFALWAVLLLAALFGIWGEKTRWGSKVSGAVITMMTTLILSNLRIIPVNAPTYEVIWSYLVPLAIPLLLFNANLKKIVFEAGPIMLAYIIGAIGVVLGTLIAYYIIHNLEASWQLAAVFCASYIGGSVNFAATAQTVGLSQGNLLSAAIAVDSLLTTFYIILLFTLPSINWVQKTFTQQKNKTIHSDKQVFSTQENHDDLRQEWQIVDILLPLTISAVICAVGNTLANFIGYSSGSILIITALIIILATAFPTYFNSMKAAPLLGTMLMQIFFAAIGASANVEMVLQAGISIFVFVILILTLHLLFLLLAGKLLKLNLAEMLIASNANIGGATTAAAMATSKDWQELVTPGILCGTLGYAVATFIGSALGNILHSDGFG